MDLRGKKVVVTGASSGIGEACARLFAEKGAEVVLVARREKRLKQVADEILQTGGEASFIVADLTKEEDIRKAFSILEKELGGIDILLNNAGRGLKARLEDISREDWDALIATNVTSVLFCTKHAVALMRKKKRAGQIITISSMAGKFGVPHFSAYCASKHAVTGLKKTLWWELRKDRIRVSTIHPGRVRTEFFRAYEKHPLDWEMLSAKDIAQYVVAVAERDSLKRAFFKARNSLKRLTNLLRIT